MAAAWQEKFASDLTTQFILKHVSDSENPKYSQLREFYDKIFFPVGMPG